MCDFLKFFFRFGIIHQNKDKIAKAPRSFPRSQFIVCPLKDFYFIELQTSL